MRFIGDIHGKFQDYFRVANGANRSVQVGDFGVGFFYDNSEINEFHASGNHRFIRGNHDNPAMCKTQMNGYIPDGTVEDGIMYIGGAWSIDQQFRTEGVSWWRDEENSYVDFLRFMGVYEDLLPEIMVTHDAPSSVGKIIANGSINKTITGEFLQQMFEIHQPKIWIFGHWHIDLDFVQNGTRFICLNELSYVDL